MLRSIPLLFLSRKPAIQGICPIWVFKILGLYIKYHKSTDGREVIIKLTDDGLDLGAIPKITYAETTIINGLIQLWVQTTAPVVAKANDVWVKTDDFSRYDVSVLTANQALSPSDNEVLITDGTFTITLHDANTPGIIKKIFNTGNGILTIIGAINGSANMNLYPKESVELVTDGIGWRY